MKIITRTIQESLADSLQSGKVMVLVGARRIGKTVLLQQIIDQIEEPHLLLNGEDIAVAEALSRKSIAHYRNLLGDHRLLIIDEAQKVPQIGQILKLMIDGLTDLRVIVTGSSAFDIANLTGEPLTGRKKTFYLFPLSEVELLQTENLIEKSENLKHRLVYGNYPELLHIPNNAEKADYLQEILNAYLLKDILTFENIKNSAKIFNLLRLIAYQVGSEVSYQELGQQLSISKNTVERYLDLLTKVFVLHKLEGFSRNMRKEVTKSSKWYFFDNGIRNVLIANLSTVGNRDDVGALWENYIISERIKHQRYRRMVVNNYFWRTYDQQEIDWVEEREGKLFGYEMKWNPKKQPKAPASWQKAYPDASFEVITPGNYMEWISDD